jgi:hypothetical protein
MDYRAGEECLQFLSFHVVLLTPVIPCCVVDTPAPSGKCQQVHDGWCRRYSVQARVQQPRPHGSPKPCERAPSRWSTPCFSWQLWYSALLCCAVLCCAVLRCAALCCAVLRCAAMLCCHAVLAILLEQTQILFAHTHVMSVLKFAVEPHAVATFQTCRRPCPGMRRGVWHWRAP